MSLTGRHPHPHPHPLAELSNGALVKRLQLSMDDSMVTRNEFTLLTLVLQVHPVPSHHVAGFLRSTPYPTHAPPLPSFHIMLPYFCVCPLVVQGKVSEEDLDQCRESCACGPPTAPSRARLA